MSKSRKNRRQRDRMWKQDRHCRQCGAETFLPEDIARIVNQPTRNLKRVPQELRDRMATIEHAHTRYESGRVSGGLHRLLCLRCNNENGARIEAQVPLEELHQRAMKTR